MRVASEDWCPSRRVVSQIFSGAAEVFFAPVCFFVFFFAIVFPVCGFQLGFR
jgi:membrane-anchored glycerophosphoryl diester phosphodiesterase (GDPDase)